MQGDTLWAATVTGKSEIAANGGQATHLVAAPDVIAAEEARTDKDGRPLWPDGLLGGTFAGVQVAASPAAGSGLLYDASRTYLAVRTDYEALISEEFAPAFERYAVALRLVVRMCAACPAPRMALRQLHVGNGGGNGEGNGDEPSGITAASARSRSTRSRAT